MSDVYSLEYGYINQAFETEPGSNRDTPPLDGKTYLDMQHCRFYASKPRKMGGFEKYITGNQYPVRAMFQVAIDDFTRVFLFRDTGVSHVDFLPNGSIGNEVDRTPIDWVVPTPGSPSLTFSVDSYTIFAEDTQETSEVIIFAAPPNSENPSQTTVANVYFAPSNSTDRFIFANQTTAGGIVVSVPYIFPFGNNGVMYSNNGESPLVWTGTGCYTIPVSNSKLLAARRFRGGLLVWSIDTLFNVVPNTTGGGFTSGEAAPQISLLSPSSIVETHQNGFVWVGNDQFYLYNGVANPIPNTTNHNYFFDNINLNYKGKVWGLYVGNFQEIWFFYPRGNKTECSDAVIYKLDENLWYDTIMARTCGLKKKLLNYPLMADSNQNIYSGSQTYAVWAHEVGYNVVNDNFSYPIESYFQTKLFDAFQQNPQINLEMIIRKMEIDIIQSGPLNIEILNYDYPKSQPSVSSSKVFLESDTQLSLSDQGRYISFKFSSNCLNGFFQMGVNQINYQLGAVKP